ncbi:glycosyltransferase family 39 protein [uncultured Thalassospira sp.]|uniref:ArnT family glycosyltransferase n=1 Tax=uncultured Thalassospira sp. TaxID=404382 RepID=UPI0030DB286D|tara:strand:- start:2304 stop:4052 length:1749 start_codon:yes stop_codon:yes gene_type:complete
MTSNMMGSKDRPKIMTAKFPCPQWLERVPLDLILPVVLFFLAVVAFVPGLSGVPPLDRDEPRFAQASKQMLEAHQYIDIRFQDQSRYKKPIGIYWLQTAAVTLTGHDAKAPLWVYRLPSFIGGILAVLLTYWVARAFFDPKTAFIAALLVGSTIILGVEARLAKTDASLLWTVILAQGALARLWLEKKTTPSWGLAFCFWTSLAVGVLIKGPISLMVIGLTLAGLFAFERDIKWFKSAVPFFGFLWFLALVLPWFLVIGKLTNYAFFQEALGHDLLGKVLEGQESHGKPPGMHLVFMAIVFWPLPGFLILSIPRIWQKRSEKITRFCASWFLPSWIVFELMGTKLPHYTMPLLPALAICVAAAMSRGDDHHAHTFFKWTGAVFLGLPALLLTIATIFLPLHLGISPSLPGIATSVVAALLVLFAAMRLVAGRAVQAVPVAIGGAFIMSAGFWGYVAPALKPIWISSRLVTAISEVAPCRNPAVAIAGFGEPSFVFLEGTNTRITSGQQAADFLVSNQPAPPADAMADSATAACRVVAIESRQEKAFLTEAQTKSITPTPIKLVQGLNINGGHHMTIGLYASP